MSEPNMENLPEWINFWRNRMAIVEAAIVDRGFKPSEGTVLDYAKAFTVALAKIESVRADTLEKCAKIAEGCVEESWHNAAKNAAIVIAEAIRDAP